MNDVDSVLAVSLGDAQAAVCSTDRGIDVVLAGDGRDPNRYGKWDTHSGYKGVVRGYTDPLGGGLSVVLVEPQEQDAELIAADQGERVLRTTGDGAR